MLIIFLLHSWGSLFGVPKAIPCRRAFQAAFYTQLVLLQELLSSSKYDTQSLLNQSGLFIRW